MNSTASPSVKQYKMFTASGSSLNPTGNIKTQHMVYQLLPEKLGLGWQAEWVRFYGRYKLSPPVAKISNYKSGGLYKRGG